MRGRIGVVIGLDLDDDAADAFEQERRTDEIGGDRVHAAGEEVSAEQLGPWHRGVSRLSSRSSPRKRGPSTCWIPACAGTSGVCCAVGSISLKLSSHRGVSTGGGVAA